MQDQTDATENHISMPKEYEGKLTDSIEQKKIQDHAITSQETKSPPTQKESSNEMSSSKIWSDITSVRVKQTKQVIEIMQQKTTVPEVLSKVDAQNVSQIGKLRPKQEFWNKELFMAHEQYLQYAFQKKQDDQIHQNNMDEFFGKDQKNQQTNEKYKKIEIQAIDLLLKKISIDQKLQRTNIIRLIDLLYKKYIIKPVKDILLPQNSQNQVDIYKKEPIFGERFYRLKDDSIKNWNRLANSQTSEANSFKRHAPGRTYGDNNVSMDNESTNENGGDYLEAIANNYVSGIRKQKFSDDPNQSPFQTRPQMNQSDKNVKPYNKGPQIQLPFDIQIPHHAARKQFNPGYNVFHGPDDEKNDRFQQQRTIAKTFVKDGYGLQIVRNYLGASIDGGSYNRAITTIIRESYKKIEDFLSKQCNVKIHSLTSSEFSLVKTPLVHCRNILRQQDLTTFFKYIAITYKFGKVKQDAFPTSQETLSLYQAILRGLNDRKSAKDLHPKPIKEKDMYYSR